MRAILEMTIVSQFCNIGEGHIDAVGWISKLDLADARVVDEYRAVWEEEKLPDSGGMFSFIVIFTHA